MSDRIEPQRFHEAGWRVVRDDAAAHFRTGSFAKGVALIDAIGALADAANHHPDVDLRYHGVTVRLRTHSERRLTERDVTLARQISDAARELDVALVEGRLELQEEQRLLDVEHCGHEPPTIAPRALRGRGPGAPVHPPHRAR